MSNRSIDQIRGSKAPSVTDLVAETRIDSPHPVGTAARIEATAAKAAADLDRGNDFESWALDEASSSLAAPETISQQVHAQAAQLAEHLRSRQQELDHREAELNARVAQFERDRRAAEIWLDERRAELEEVAPAGDSVVIEDEAIRRKAEALAERERYITEREAELENQRAALQRFHEQLASDRQVLEEQGLAQRERLAADEIRLAAEIDQQRREIQRRSEQTDQAHAALQQFRAELGRMHRETLEIRLATEELWAELSGAAPPAALTQSLGRIRSRLADHYRLANLELHQKKEELESLRRQLSEQYEKLVRQKRNFDAWSAQCREEVEDQAARLLARGEDLDRREADMAEYARRLQAEKLELQHEIRHLRAKLMGKAGVELPA